ncbi:ANTAR domain-containing protein [Streptomyces canus]|uniref:ANTAR domain-containing protein n=1 Tax=Streptomyces canus TaxID=58343 RepID=UPI0007C6E95A|nr:ANTAR domain-containing protein [Streptomyces canus]
MQAEIGRLQEAIVSHAVIDHAIGVVIGLGGLRSDQGFQVLRDVSQHTNIRLRQVREQIVDWVHDGQLNDEIRTTLEEALVTARSSGPGTGPTEEITARRRDGAWRRECSRSRVLGLLVRRHPATFATALVSLVRAVGTALLRPGLPRLQFAALLWRAAALLAASLFRLLWIGHVRTPRSHRRPSDRRVPRGARPKHA